MDINDYVTITNAHYKYKIDTKELDVFIEEHRGLDVEFGVPIIYQLMGGTLMHKQTLVKWIKERYKKK